MTYEEFSNKFDGVAAPMIDSLKEDLFEQEAHPYREVIVAQLMMDNLFPHPCDPEADANWPDELTTEQKKFLVVVAAHMGPDWCQALYRAAVFMTKVV